jgi:glycosyltransferase involved in cell wall biosynthesis
MKICFLAPFGIRPKGTVMARMLPLAAGLQDRGHRVVIIAPPYTNPEDSGKVETVAGVRLVNITLPALGKALGALPMAWRIFRAMQAEQPDLVHLFKPKGYPGLAAMLLVLLKRAGMRLPPLFVDTDDWEGKGGMNDLHPYSAAEKRLFAFQEHWLSRQAVGVTVASRTLEGLTGEMGVPPERIFYLPNCIETRPPGTGWRVRSKLGIPADAPVVLLYTRFFEFSQERLHLLLAEIRRRVPEVRLLVIGRGRNLEEEQLISAAVEHDFQHALLPAGWLEPEVIPDYLAAADVAIYPLDDTLINRAKCPAKLTELLAAGVPVVADAVGQAMEYIKPGESGLLCRPGDWQGMADAVVALLESGERRRAIGEAGRQHLLEHFSWRQFVPKLAHFYQIHSNL